MDIEALKGLADAVEAEARQPAPSHSNLARLVAMFMRQIIASKELKPEPKAVELPVVEMDEPKLKKTKGNKK